MERSEPLVSWRDPVGVGEVMPETIVSVILAAGDSRRMGSPKPLLRLSNSTFLQQIIDTHLCVGLPVCVVLGDDSPAVERYTDLDSVTVFRNPDPSRGPLSSLQTALAHISHSEAIILHPVDHPLVQSQTIARLVQTFHKLSHCILIPECNGRKGHPVLFPAKYYADLLGAPLTGGARAVVRANRAANHLVEVRDPAILANVNTWEQYQDLFGYRRLDRPSGSV